MGAETDCQCSSRASWVQIQYDQLSHNPALLPSSWQWSVPSQIMSRNKSFFTLIFLGIWSPRWEKRPIPGVLENGLQLDHTEVTWKSSHLTPNPSHWTSLLSLTTSLKAASANFKARCTESMLYWTWALMEVPAVGRTTPSTYPRHSSHFQGEENR